MMGNDNGERRLLWKIIDVLVVLMLTITFAFTGWTLTQVVGLQIELARIGATQGIMMERVGRIERLIDAEAERQKETTRKGG